MADTAGQSAADSEAADRREAHLKAAADSLAAQRARDDEEIAQQRLAEDEALADARTEQDRVLASSRARLSGGGAPTDLAAVIDRVSFDHLSPRDAKFLGVSTKTEVRGRGAFGRSVTRRRLRVKAGAQPLLGAFAFLTARPPSRGTTGRPEAKRVQRQRAVAAPTQFLGWQMSGCCGTVAGDAQDARLLSGFAADRALCPAQSFVVVGVAEPARSTRLGAAIHETRAVCGNVKSRLLQNAALEVALIVKLAEPLGSMRFGTSLDRADALAQSAHWPPSRRSGRSGRRAPRRRIHQCASWRRMALRSLSARSASSPSSAQSSSEKRTIRCLFFGLSGTRSSVPGRS